MSKAKTLTTNKLIHSLKLRASIPVTDNTFTEEDFLYFLNEEMDLGVVPHITQYHEDYFLFSEYVDVEQGKTRYTIPDRAVGVKLRDVAYDDGNGLIEFTRISVEDLTDKYVNFQTYNFKAFYIEGDEVVIPDNLQTGRLKFSYYIRPNTLVSEDNVSVVTNINRNNGIVTVDKIPDNMLNQSVFDIVSSKSSFRLVAKEITPDNVDTEDKTFTFGTQKSAEYTLPTFGTIVPSSYLSIYDNSSGLNQQNVFWFDVTGSDVPPVVSGANLFRVDISLAGSNSAIISTLTSIINSSFVDGRIVSGSVSANVFFIENGGLGVSVGNNFSVVCSFITEAITSAGTVTIPDRLNLDDVIALPEETIIPQIPIELHAMLAHRAAMRCLEALGDNAGLQAAAAKLADMENRTGALLNDRVESAPLKIVPRHTPIKRALHKNYRRR